MIEKAVIHNDCAANGSRCLVESLVKAWHREPRRADDRDRTWPHDLSDDLPAKILLRVNLYLGCGQHEWLLVTSSLRLWLLSGSR